MARVVGIIRNCVEKRGGTTGVLYQRAREKGKRERTGYVRTKVHRDTALRHRRRELDTDTERRKRMNVCINKNNKQEATTHNRVRIGYSRTGRRTDADACSLQHREALQDGGAAGSTRAFLRAARASPKTCTHESYGAGERKTKREASGIGPTALRPLCARDPFFFLVLLLL